MSRLLQDVVGELSKLPGVGRRTALRLAIHILRMERESVAEMTESIDRFRNEVKYCTQCNNLSDEEVCPICADDERDHTTICVVEQVADVLSVENTRQYKGLYHVLGGVISPMQGISPSDLKIDLLTERIARGGVKEVILAISTSVEGETHALLPDEPPPAVPGTESHLHSPRHRLRRRTGICRRADHYACPAEPPRGRMTCGPGRTAGESLLCGTTCAGIRPELSPVLFLQARPRYRIVPM